MNNLVGNFFSLKRIGSELFVQKSEITKMVHKSHSFRNHTNTNVFHMVDSLNLRQSILVWFCMNACEKC